MPKTLSNKYTLPANPTWIDIPRSDGDPGRWPDNTTPVLDANGHVNFYRPVAVSEGAAIGWRVTFGRALAMKLGYVEGPDYVLRDWPAGYAFFDHNKGPADAPRHDPYLFGCTSVRVFRSAPEFIPHAYWLMTDPTLDRGNCECKYCAKVPQRVISEGLGLSRRSGTPMGRASTPVQLPPETSISARRPAVTKETFTRPARPAISAPAKAGAAAAAAAVAVGRAPKGSTSSSRKFKNYIDVAVHAVLPFDEFEHADVPRGRLLDVRAAASRSELTLPRWLRQGEVAWCKLAPAPLHRAIEYWPGIVVDYRVKSKAEVLGPPPGAGAPPPLRVMQWTEYRIKLLGVAHTVCIRDTEVLPYQAYRVGDERFQDIVCRFDRNAPVDWPALEKFDPFAAGAAVFAFQGAELQRELLSTETLGRACLPFCVATEVASRLLRHWTPTDQFVHTYRFGAPADARAKGKARAAQELALHLASDGRLALHAPHPRAPTACVEYHGLWWGPERIWAGDFVRLKPLRGEWLPDGFGHVLCASGPTPGFARRLARALGPAADAGAAQRGLFMAIRALQHVYPAAEGGDANVRAFGMIYELASADWVEPQAPAPAPPAGDLPPPSPSPPDVPARPAAPERPPGAAPSPHTPDAYQLRLPPAPPGLKFRPIVAGGHEACIGLGLIAGRYYARLVDHPLLDPTMSAAHAELAPHVAALYGLDAGAQNAINPVQHAPSRDAYLDAQTVSSRRSAEEIVATHFVARSAANASLDADGDVNML